MADPYLHESADDWLLAEQREDPVCIFPCEQCRTLYDLIKYPDCPVCYPEKTQ